MFKEYFVKNFIAGVAITLGMGFGVGILTSISGKAAEMLDELEKEQAEASKKEVS